MANAQIARRIAGVGEKLGRRTREKLAAEYNFDVAAFFADLRRRRAGRGGSLVLQKKRAESTA